MTLRDMVSTLVYPQTIEVRDEWNMELLITSSDSYAIEPYLDKDVLSWFAGNAPFKTSDFVVRVG